MCTGLEIALIAGSTALGAANNADSQRKQNRIASDSLRRNSELNREAGRRVSDEIQNVKTSTPDSEASGINQEFMDALRRAKVADGGDALTGAGSDRFADDLDLARTAAGDEGKRTAGILSRIDAPQMQRVGESTNVSRAATDLQLIGGRGQSGDFIDQLRMSRAGPDPGIDALASFGSALGMARAGRAKPGAAVPTTTTPAAYKARPGTVNQWSRL